MGFLAFVKYPGVALMHVLTRRAWAAIFRS